MPIVSPQEQMKPVKTVDMSNNTTTETAPSPMDVSNSGATFNSKEALLERLKTKAVQLQEQEQAQSSSSEEAKPEAAAENKAESKDESKSDKEARKLFLKAQKAERKAQQQLKASQESIKKAEAFEKAKEQKDLVSQLKALGLNEAEVYDALTKHALKQLPEDPIKAKLEAQELELKKVAERLEAQQAELKKKEEAAMEATALHQLVVPVIANNPDKYETIIAYNGDDPIKAAKYVYETAKTIFFEQGSAPSFEELADGLEKYHEEQTATGIERALRMKKFSARYGKALAPSSETNDQKPVPKDDPIRNKTLTNEIAAAPTQVKSFTYTKDRDQRIKNVLSKFK